MQAVLFVLVACSGLSLTSSQVLPSDALPLGAKCDPKIAGICAGGASCYATNSMLMPRCGNFQAICTSDAQCAFNVCNAGFCNGIKPSATITDSSTISTELTASASGTPSLPITVPQNTTTATHITSSVVSNSTTVTGILGTSVHITSTLSPTQSITTATSTRPATLTSTGGSNQFRASRFPELFAIGVAWIFI